MTKRVTKIKPTASKRKRLPDDGWLFALLLVACIVCIGVCTLASRGALNSPPEPVWQTEPAP